MFRRTETARERALLRLIESLQQQIRDLTNQVIWLSGRAPFEEPGMSQPMVEDEETYISALETVPPTWGDD